MKKVILFFSLLAFLVACSGEGDKAGNSELEQKKAELQELRKEQTALLGKIGKLEAEVMALKPESSVRKTAVNVATPTKTTFRHFISLQGALESKNAVNISPRMAGRITKVYVKEGQSVRKGQTLAAVDASVMYTQRKELETALDLAKTLFEKQERLRKQDVGTEVDYLQAKNQVERLEKQIKSLNSQIAMSSITSTIAGVVDEVFVKEGESAAPGMPTFRVINQSDVVVSVPVSDKYLGNITKGQELSIIFPDTKDTVGGKVTFVSGNINPVNRTFEIEAVINPKEKPQHIRANMLAIVKINDKTVKDALLVDKNFLKNTEKGTQILVAQQKDGNWEAVAKDVKTGLDYAGQVVIEEGLKPEDKVITMGYQDLVPGAQLKLVE